MTSQLNLLPGPRSLSRTGDTLSLRAGLIALQADPAAELWFTGRRIQSALSDYAGLDCAIVGGADDEALVTVTLSSTGHPEGYRLSITTDGITITGNDPAGAFYGAATLIQLLQTHGAALPALEIDDYPDFPARGVMLDISRDKVPTMDTVRALVDWLAGLKINQFQLYTEHTFAYRQHPKVWAQASPFTAEEILELDAYCRERYIELVPNQNSFGHMHRWLAHEAYRHMAEVPDGHDWYPFFMDKRPFGLSPAVPESAPFLAGLYAELLPNFTSRYFNVGCDETFDLGQGRSKVLCEAKGKGRVYLDFLMRFDNQNR